MIRLNDITSQVLGYHPKADVSLIEKAYVYSAKVHQGQMRLSGEPYLSHPLEVAYFLTTMKMDVVTVAAGLLHDTVENTDVTPEELEAEFGPRVTQIVLGCTEDMRLEWEKRKEIMLASLAKAPLEVRLVAAADKVDNLRAISRDLAERGDEVWTRFRRGREKQEWYYRSVARTIRFDPGRNHGLFALLEREVEGLFGPG